MHGIPLNPMGDCHKSPSPGDSTMVLGQMDIKRMKLNSYLTPYIKIN